MRHSTNLWEWSAAKAIAEQFERAGDWDGFIPTPPQPESEIPTATRITVETAVKAFLDQRSEDVSPNTQRQNKATLERLKTFSEKKGYVMLDQWATMDVREFRSSWNVAANTAAKDMGKVKTFFYLLRREWLVTGQPRQAGERGQNQIETSRAHPLDACESNTRAAVCYEMRRTFGLVFAALFERQLRAWLTGKSVAREKKIEVARWDELMGLVATVDAAITVHPTMNDLSEMHLVANAVRHGNGQSATKLMAEEPEFWIHLHDPASKTDLIGNTRIDDDHLFRYRRAAARFWHRAGASQPPF